MTVLVFLLLSFLFASFMTWPLWLPSLVAWFTNWLIERDERLNPPPLRPVTWDDLPCTWAGSYASEYRPFPVPEALR